MTSRLQALELSRAAHAFPPPGLMAGTLGSDLLPHVDAQGLMRAYFCLFYRTWVQAGPLQCGPSRAPFVMLVGLQSTLQWGSDHVSGRLWAVLPVCGGVLRPGTGRTVLGTCALPMETVGLFHPTATIAAVGAGRCPRTGTE